jgi:hypothetical protein
MSSPPPALPTHGRPFLAVDRAGCASLSVPEVTVDGLIEYFIDLLWWIRR